MSGEAPQGRQPAPAQGRAEAPGLGRAAGPRRAAGGEEPGVRRAARLETLSAAQVTGILGLLPHREGGYFRETYRSPVVMPTPLGVRSLSTSIIYLLAADEPSRFHRLRFDEVWFFHAGAPVELVFLDPLETLILGPEAPQALAPGGRWMAARVVEAATGAGQGASAEVAGTAKLGRGRTDTAARDELPAPECGGQTGPVFGSVWALVGCMVSPGFEYDDFEAGHSEELLRSYPEAAGYIRALTGG